MRSAFVAVMVLAGLGPVGAAAQQQQPPLPGGIPPPPPAAVAEGLRPSYVLGTNDQIVIRAFEVEEVSNSPYLVDTDGNITIPLIGKVKAAGLSVQQLEESLTELLKKFVRQPQVTVTVVQFRSEPAFFVGAFRSPGIYPLRGKRMLVEMLTVIGGLAPNASSRIKITRRAEYGRIPLPSAQEDPEKKVSVVEISLGSLRQSVNPAEDIELMPFDVVSADRAEMVFLAGEVGRVGGFELGDRNTISVLQILTMAGGPSRDANLAGARILRPVLDTAQRAQIPINLKDIYKGKAIDYPLVSNDVLYIPKTLSKGRIARNFLIYGLPLLPTIYFLINR